MSSELRLLQAHLTRWSRRFRLVDALHLASRSLWPALLGVLLIELAARLWPIPDRHLWALLPLEIWLIGLLLYSLLRPLPPWQIARRLDQTFQLKDRLATAWELQTPNLQSPRFAPNPHASRPILNPYSQPASQTVQPSTFNVQSSNLALRTFQLSDALTTAQDLTTRSLPWQVPRRPLWLAGGLSALALLLALLPNPMDPILAQRAAIQAEALEQSQAIEETRRELERATDPISKERAEALQSLSELMKELAANPGDLEQALADLAEAEARLQALQDPDALARQTATEQVATQLTALSRGETQASSELTEAETALAELAASLAAMDPADQAEIAEALETMAAQAAATDAELAEALLDMAAAAEAGDVSGALAAATQAQQALARSDQAARLQNALAAAQARLENSRQALAQQGALAQGQRQGAGQGQSPGQGQNPGQGQVGSGGGTTADQLPGANRSGAAGRPSRPNRPAGVTESETVYAPGNGIHRTGNPEFVPGQQTADGQEIVREERAPQPGATNPSLVPYRDVYQDYAAAAAEAVDRERIPPELRDYVRDYFSQLAPE